MAAQFDMFPAVLDQHEEFAAYVAARPDVLRVFQAETVTALRNGEQPGKIGAKAIAERCRAQVRSPKGGYGIDNRWVTLLSRLVEERLQREIFRKRKTRV